MRKHFGFYDSERQERGNAGLVDCFRNTVHDDARQAVEYLNDDDLGFPSLYVLLDEITRYGLGEQLSERNRAASEFVKDANSGSYGHTQTIHAMLKWMIETDESMDMDHGYLRKIDTAAGMLTSIYGDKSILPFIANELFNRYRRGLPYHYLAWAFFEARDPNSLAMIAERLHSSDWNETECSHRLLGFIPGMEKGGRVECYWKFCGWLEENEPFLWYKGESFDTTHQPRPYVVILEAKYLGHVVDLDNGRLYTSLTEEEKHRLQAFADLPHGQQGELASKSARKRQLNRQQWRDWLDLPINEQMEAGEGGESRD